MNETQDRSVRLYEHPSAWRGVDVAQSDNWQIRLTPDQNRELRQAMAHARERGVQIPALTAADFPCPRWPRSSSGCAGTWSTAGAFAW